MFDLQESVLDIYTLQSHRFNLEDLSLIEKSSVQKFLVDLLNNSNSVFEMSAKCAGELLYIKYRESSLHFFSSRRSTAYRLVIVSFDASCNSIYNLVCSYYL